MASLPFLALINRLLSGRVMNQSIWKYLSLSFFGLGVFGNQASASARPHLFLCGGPEVREGVLSAKHGQASLHEIWHWRPENSDGLPENMRRKFAATDDCKPVSDGKEVLVTSSGNAVALVSHATGATLFYATVNDAHSAELMPGGYIAVASSTDPGRVGNAVLLFDRRTSDKPISSVTLLGAHGVVWDAHRNVLWALGAEELLRLDLVETAGRRELKVQAEFQLPQKDGHDLQLAPDQNSLLVTTGGGVYAFTPASESWTSSKLLPASERIKSLSIRRDNGWIAYTKADPGVWWTYTVRFEHPTMQWVSHEIVYKVRWIP
jgi:hypothetical protein